MNNNILDNFSFQYDFYHLFKKENGFLLYFKDYYSFFEEDTDKQFKIINKEEKGTQNEQNIINILNCFNTQIIPSKTLSKLDCEYKTDVLVNLNNIYLAIQIKSSLNIIKGCLDSSEIIQPLYIHSDPNQLNKIFKEISKFLSVFNISLKPEVKLALNIYKSFDRRHTYTTSMFTCFNSFFYNEFGITITQLFDIYQTLGLVINDKQSYTFISSNKL